MAINGKIAPGCLSLSELTWPPMVRLCQDVCRLGTHVDSGPFFSLKNYEPSARNWQSAPNTSLGEFYQSENVDVDLE